MYNLYVQRSKTELNALEFSKQCLALLDNLPAGGVLITKRGRPIAQLIPVETAAVDNSHLFGALKGRLTIEGDILSTGDRWDAESGHAHPTSHVRRKPDAQ